MQHRATVFPAQWLLVPSRRTLTVCDQGRGRGGNGPCQARPAVNL